MVLIIYEINLICEDLTVSKGAVLPSVYITSYF